MESDDPHTLVKIHIVKVGQVIQTGFKMCINSRSRRLTTGSLNVRGIKDTEQQMQLADDMKKYNLDILGIQETHLRGTGSIDIKTSDNKEVFELYYTGPKDNSYHGVGIITRKDLQADYKTISEIVCMATIRLEKDKRNLNFISTYAPTLEVSEKNENIRKEYYRSLNDTIRNISNRSMIIVAGDMNAETGSGHREHPEVVGRYGKGEVNSNGEHLIEFALQNELFLTNTKFPHKFCHRTTWVGPERRKEFKDQKSGELKRNPYRNQIDYVMIRRRDLNFVEDSRSYGV